MKTLAKKTRFALLIYTELIAGILCYVLIVAVTGLLIWFSANGARENIDDLIVAVIILIVFYTFCAVGGGWLISRFVKWKKLPEVLISADDEYLFIYTNREVKIAFKDVESVFAGPESLFVQLFGGGYGVVEITANNKKYKVRFVDAANRVPDAVMGIINR